MLPYLTSNAFEVHPDHYSNMHIPTVTGWWFIFQKSRVLCSMELVQRLGYGLEDPSFGSRQVKEILFPLKHSDLLRGPYVLLLNRY
jgi:hypothetical protein